MAMLLCAFSANAQGGGVAKIGSTTYATFAETLTAASAMSGDVTIEVYDKVTLNTAFSGSYSSINFVGKDTDAEIYLDVQGYITATGKKVSFTDLTLSKSAGGYMTNAGFMNVAFGIYDVVEVAYTNCVFANGAYASSGNVTFDNCTFYRSHDKYGLWAYGNVDVAVEGCTFADYRGIKMYAEGAAKTVDLTVKDTDFSAVTDKPAIVLTYGESVVLEGNTYSSTGTFELDLDGAPNGTAVTSDVAPTCKNDNGTCGVLVDGKIYTTVAQAAAVAAEGSNVTLLYSTTDAVEFAEGVNLTRANGVIADNVTVATSGVAKIGDTTYATLSAAFAAVTDDAQTVVVLQDVTEELTGAYLRGNITTENGAKVTINLTNSDWVYCPYTFVLGENITLNVPALFYYAGGAQINGAVITEAYYQRYAGTKLTINEPGSLTVTTEMFYIRYTDNDANAGIYVNGDNNDETVGLNLSVAYFYQGMIYAKDANIKTSVYWQTNETDGQGSANLVLDNSTLDVTVNEHNFKATGNSTVTLTNGSSIVIAGAFETGQNTEVSVDATSSIQDANGPVVIPVAKVGDVKYATLAEAVAAAQAGDEIILLADVTEDAILPAGVKFNGNGKTVGNLTAGGEITFTGVTKATSFGVQYINTTVNIVPDACLEITGTGRMVIGHGCTFNITGSIEDAKTADVAALTPSLIIPGASFTGAGVTFNVTNAYIKATAYCSSKNNNANGTFNFNVTNSVWEQGNTLVFSAPTNSMDPTFNLNLVNSVLNSTSHLVFAVTKGEIVIDNSNVNVGTARQIENRSTMTIKNGSVVNGAVATSQNAKNPGTLIVEDATYAVTGEFSGSDLGTGTLIVNKGATVSAGSITKANIQIDATGMAAGDEVNLTADLSKLVGTIEVINNDNLDASIVDGKIVLVAVIKPVAKIGETTYATLAAAVAAATDGATVTLLDNTTLDDVVTIEMAITIDLNEKTVTGADGAIVFNIKADATIKNGTILGNKSGTTSGLIDIYANLAMDGVTLETSKINALRFKAGDCTATLDNCNITGAFKGYGSSVWAINSGTYKAASTSINDQLNGTAQISGGTFHYEITDEECAPGYSVVNNGDGTYTVKYAPVCFVDTNNNGTLDEGETVYGSLAAVFNTIKEGDVYIVLTSNTAIAEQVDTDADAKYYLNTNVAEGVTVDFAFADDWNYVQKMYVGEGVTLNAPYLLAWTDFEVHGTINTGYLYIQGGDVLVAEGAVVNATTGDATVQVKNGATLTVNGELNTSILNVWVGESKLIVSGDNAKVNAKWVDIWDGTPVVDVENGATLAVKDIKASRGGSIEVADATLAATGTIELGHNRESTGTLTETGNSTITGNIKLTVEGSTVKSDGGLTNVTTDLVGYGVVYENGEYKVVALPAYVAKIGEQGYETLAAALAAAQDGDVVTLVWADGDAPIAMNGSVFGKNVTITGTATVDWSKGFLFVGRGGEGNATVTFDGANLTSASDQASTGIHVSGREKGTNNKYDGTLVIKNSTIELDYLINKNTMSLDNSTLTVKNGFSIGGRPASETESGADATATISLANNSKVIVNDHNGMGLGYEAIGVMNIDATSTFEATQAFLVTAKGTMNVAAGGAVSVNGTLTVNGTLVSAGNIAATIAAGTGATIEISGGVYTQDVNEWCVENYAALPDLNGNYVVGVKPTATVNDLGQMTIPAGGYMVYGGGINSVDMPLSFVMQFLADQTAADMATSPFADWYGDFVITFTGLENGKFTADGCYLAGHYGDFGWVKVPVDGMLIEDGVRYPVMLGVGMGQKYDYICSSVEDFKCALYLTPEILEANPNIQVKLELAVVDNSNDEDAAASALVNNDKVYSVTEYTYNADDFVVDPNYIAELVIDDAKGENYTNDTEKRVGTLTYKRTLINGKWNALYLPFEVELTDELLANYDFADYNQMISHDTNGDRVPDSFEMELFIYTSGTLDANYPYFVRPKNEEACSMNLVLTDAALYPANEISLVTSSVKNTFKLSGTYKAMGAEELAGKYAISIDGDWSYTSALKPYRLYFTITDNNSSVVTSVASKSVRIVVRGEDGYTGVEGVENENGEDMIFDLQGRRVLEPEKGGIYIKNGKKIIF